MLMNLWIREQSSEKRETINNNRDLADWKLLTWKMCVANANDSGRLVFTIVNHNEPVLILWCHSCSFINKSYSFISLEEHPHNAAIVWLFLNVCHCDDIHARSRKYSGTSSIFIMNIIADNLECFLCISIELSAIHTALFFKLWYEGNIFLSLKASVMLLATSNIEGVTFNYGW